MICGAALLMLVGCEGGEPELPAAAVVAAPAPVHVDSIIPVEEEIRRFKVARHGTAAAVLQGASASRDELVARFMKALESRDTAELRAMVMSAAEYIDLYYPTSIYTHAPYRQPPEPNWFLLQQHSAKSIERALGRFKFVSYGNDL